jgi:hypothetical protein
MKKIGRIAIAVIAAGLFAVTAWALPPTGANNTPNTAASQAQVALQSVSGTIASVQNNFFTLTTSTSTSRGQKLIADRVTSKTMTFLIDDNTAVDGELTVGANASVVYREDAGNNVAVSVTVAK